MEDVSVLAPLILESFGVEVRPVESRLDRTTVELWWSSESEDEYPIPIGRYKVLGISGLHDNSTVKA
ncbi:hypothetical protein E3N88_36316 [Mikania micrantha]|uniref:Uncharacterized protein n=1 Tax=Mikania micrantha TaxID=192012 RepID=A0A5N6M4E5_9ASTR|nr:hypothetical protein E3N88_36316 [Mikania micrantha]